MRIIRNRIEWIHIKSDFDGMMSICIKRENQDDEAKLIPWYRPSDASKQRALKLAEQLVAKYTSTFEFGELTGKLKMLIHMNLPLKS